MSEFVGAKLAKDPTLEMVTTIKALTEFAAPTVGARTRSVEVPRATTRRMEPPGRGDHAVPGAAQILVPVDFTDDSLRALNFAGGLAREFGASIALVHVVARSGFAGRTSTIIRKGASATRSFIFLLSSDTSAPARWKKSDRRPVD